MSEIYIGENGNWYIDGVDTGKPSRGQAGLSAYEIAVTLGYQGTLTDWVNTLKGEAGQTPHIGENGNWFIGGEDTGILADAEQLVNKKITEALKEIENKVIFQTISLGSYNIEPEIYTDISVPYTPPEGYKVVGFTLQLPPRYLAALRYTGGTFNGTLFNHTQRSGTYSVNALITLEKQ